MSNALLAGIVRMGPGERLNLSISFANRLATGEHLTNPVAATLTDQTTGRPQMLPTAAIATDPIVSQFVSNLTSGHRYLLDVVVTTTAPVPQTLEGQIEIICEGRPHLVL